MNPVRRQFVRSYSPRRHLLQRAAIAVTVLVAIVAVAFGGLAAVRRIGAAPQIDVPAKHRVVDVRVQR